METHILWSSRIVPTGHHDSCFIVQVITKLCKRDFSLLDGRKYVLEHTQFEDDRIIFLIESILYLSAETSFL